nr:hypothetical protein [Methylobacterium nodulans]
MDPEPVQASLLDHHDPGELARAGLGLALQLRKAPQQPGQITAKVETAELTDPAGIEGNGGTLMADGSTTSEGPQASAAFSPGECVFDPDRPWDQIRGGIISDRDGDLWLWIPVVTTEELKADPYTVRVAEYPGRLTTNVLLNYSLRRSKIDPAPYLDIRTAALNLL